MNDGLKRGEGDHINWYSPTKKGWSAIFYQVLTTLVGSQSGPPAEVSGHLPGQMASALRSNDEDSPNKGRSQTTKKHTDAFCMVRVNYC